MPNREEHGAGRVVWGREPGSLRERGQSRCPSVPVGGGPAISPAAPPTATQTPLPGSPARPVPAGDVGEVGLRAGTIVFLTSLSVQLGYSTRLEFPRMIFILNS